MGRPTAAHSELVPGQSVAGKRKHYQLLMALMRMLFENGDLERKNPKFYPTAATTRGELAMPFQHLIEAFVKERKAIATEAWNQQTLRRDLGQT